MGFLSLQSIIPPGTIFPYAGTTAPAGWALCNGGSYTTTAQSALFAVIGYSHGGSGANFNVPDYRGRFLRGVDGGTGRDPDSASRTAMNAGGNTGSAVGSVQPDQFKSHTHTWSVWGGNVNGGSNTWGSQSVVNTANPATSATGGNETRPLNAYVNYIIKL